MAKEKRASVKSTSVLEDFPKETEHQDHSITDRFSDLLTRSRLGNRPKIIPDEEKICVLCGERVRLDWTVFKGKRICFACVNKLKTIIAER